MNAATEQTQYGANIYTNAAHIIKTWKSVSERKYVTLCGRSGGGNSALFEGALPSCYNLCPKCAEKASV